MKTNNIFKMLLAGFGAMTMASCNDYLDKLPDDRAELNTIDKITMFNTSCYPEATPNLILEMLSDNVCDYGPSYTAQILCDELYRFKDVTDQGNDSPYFVWNQFYSAVAAANQSIAAIKENNFDCPAQLAEAKLCRAYGMFMLANVFCMGWNPEKADEYLGLPYPLEPEKNLNTSYERGTLRQLYEAINKDIEEALPYIDDAIYQTPKFHFNRQAAYAFAARFNLYYLNYDKAIEYANEVLGTGNPIDMLRNYASYAELGRRDLANQYVQSSEPWNLMLTTPYSIAPYYLSYGGSARFNHNMWICSYETYWADMPWGSGTKANCSYYANKLYGSNPCVAYPKFDPFVEYTDRVAGIGYYHGVDPVFTTDETLLCRAEAYIMKGSQYYDKGVEDINYWIQNHCKDSVEVMDDKNENVEEVIYRPVMTVETICQFEDGLKYAPITPRNNGDRGIKKVLNPQGFTVEAGEQENLIQFLLQCRRLETVAQGLRFIDCKRYGIEYDHFIYREDNVTFKAGDLRAAVQLPVDVITAGLEPNPRD